jgi:hypothetical protein
VRLWKQNTRYQELRLFELSNLGMLASRTALGLRACRAPVHVMLMARIAEVQPVAFNPFSRERNSASFNSSCNEGSMRSHLKLYLYHSSDGETFDKNWRSRTNSSKRGHVCPPKASTQIWREPA